MDLPHIIYSHSHQPVNTFPLWDDPKADLIFKTIFKDFHVISLFCTLTRQVRRFLYLSDQYIGYWFWSFIIFFIFALKTLQKPFAIRNISVTLPLVIIATVACKLLGFKMLKQNRSAGYKTFSHLYFVGLVLITEIWCPKQIFLVICSFARKRFLIFANNKWQCFQ